MYELGAGVTVELCREWLTSGKIRGLVIGRKPLSQRVH